MKVSNQKNTRQGSGTRSSQPGGIEWARINGRQVVVATGNQMWIHDLAPDAGQDPFAEPMGGPGSMATTRRLLEAAWCAGLMAAPNRGSVPSKSLTSYVWELIGYHHTTSATPRLLTEAATRFRDAGRPDLEAFARRFARLETGDERMAVEDLEALGYQAAVLVRQCSPPPSAVACADYYASLVRGSAPIMAFGYAYAVERSSLSITREDLRAYEELLPPGINAIHCRRHHSGVGGDVAHVEYIIHAISRLPASDRASIARATYDAALFIYSVPVETGSDDTLERLFSPYRSHRAETGREPAPQAA